MENPILKCDYPDPDVIRVGDTYYMLSTTMHFFPGGAVLRSYDLVHWELINYLYDILENTAGARLEKDAGIYGQGMWAPSLRYHEGTFYVCFVANDTHKTYLFYTKDIMGTWQRQEIEGFYHDASLLFDDSHVYIVYGNTEIYITELTPDLRRPKEGGLHRLLIKDTGHIRLGYEGCHIYKINGKYYLFMIHWGKDESARRSEACFVSDSLTGEFKGRDVLDDDIGYHNQGVAQGGIVDTPEGNWYAILFQDSGAVGRIPVLLPVHFEDDFPVFGVDGKTPRQLQLPGIPASRNTSHSYEPLFTSSFTDDNGLPKLQWQWNHLPDTSYYTLEQTGYTITTNKLCTNITQAVNTLTQRLMYPDAEIQVTLDGSQMNDGDTAGLAALQGCYAYLGLTKENGSYFLVLTERNRGEISQNMKDMDILPGTEAARIPIASPTVTLRMYADFSDMKDEVSFFYQSENRWVPVGTPHKLYFLLDHFVGCRLGLFLYSAKKTGGQCRFSHFTYLTNTPERVYP